MTITGVLQKAEKFEIQAYERPKDLKGLRKTHVSFTGSPLRHPYDSERIVLLTDPYSTNATYYEFRTEDISHVEKLPNLVNMDGETVTMVRVWVKKMTVGLRYTPFIVEDTAAQ